MKDSIIIKFLYNTIVGRLLLIILVNPKLSKLAAGFFSSKASAWLVPIYIHKNNINLKYYEVPAGGYTSFNDFFTRKMKSNYTIENDSVLVSPCDAFLSYSSISKDLIFNIKHTQYSVKDLLNNEQLANEYMGGTAFIFRLTPAHYHRFDYCTSGIAVRRKKIKGKLHSVQPICHEKCKVFVQNSREYLVIENSKLGNVVQMEIGALLVGKIKNKPLKKGQFVHKGFEKGNFEYGGSSIVVLVKDKVEVASDILNRDMVGSEYPVFIGEALIN